MDLNFKRNIIRKQYLQFHGLEYTLTVNIGILSASPAFIRLLQQFQDSNNHSYGLYMQSHGLLSVLTACNSPTVDYQHTLTASTIHLKESTAFLRPL